MMKTNLLVLISLLSVSTIAAEIPPKGSEDSLDLRIGLSPAAVKKAERGAKLELYRRAVDGDGDARKDWLQFAPDTRVSLLGELALTREDSVARKQAIIDLARLKPDDDPKAEGLIALASVALAAGDGSMRDLGRKALAARDDKRSPSILASALRSNDALVRGNVAAAMKAIGGPRIFEVIIEHWKESWGAGPRSHALYGTQRSYVADYDISGDSYDPVIRSFITGTVLDSKILRVESDVYYVTIREVTPFEADLPNNIGAWEKWLQKERPRLARDAEKKKVLALSALGGSDEE